MKGRNEMTLNEQTMVEAVQEWLDKRWADPKPVVKSVKPVEDKKGAYDSRHGDFLVTLEAADTPEPAA